MIVKPSFFKNEIYLPHANPSISDSVTGVESKLVDFINRYEREALERCLGKLSIEFFKNLDASEPSFIKASSDVKWDQLMNGHTYTKPNGDELTWKGIRRHTMPLGMPVSDEPDYSFLAEYVYFHYESNDFITRADSGNAKVKPANAYVEKPNNKVIKAWRRFTEAVQGNTRCSNYFYKSGFLGGFGVDYYGFGNHYDVSLYQFIRDMNNIDSDTYPDFTPKIWGQINQFTI